MPTPYLLRIDILNKKWKDKKMNKDLFRSNPGNVKEAISINEAGGKAYELSDKAALAQYALTGTLFGTFYSSDEEQLTKILELANKCDVEYVAKLSVYARQKGLMKDIPSLLAAYVAAKDVSLLQRIFFKVIDDPKMFRNFIKVIRSGITGRKSFGSRPKKLLQKWLENLTDEQLFKASVGNDPSLEDCLKMIRPKAANEGRNALYGYLLGKDHSAEALLPIAREYEAFKKNMDLDIPNVPFQMLTALSLTPGHWKKIAQRATWNQIRHNLNAFSSHNVFEDKAIVEQLAAKLSDPDEVRRANVFPYQLFSTFINVQDNVPVLIKIALQKAAEIATENVPAIEGDVAIALDVSGSMRDPVTGKRGTASTKMRCVDVASMIAASIVRKNPTARIIPFDTVVKQVNLNPLDSVMTNAQKLAAAGANGGTDCAAALAFMNEQNMKAQTVVYVSDNQSWAQSTREYPGYRGYAATGTGTTMMHEWATFERRNRGAKLINIDIAPYGTTQVYDKSNTINVGGFSDQVFEVVSMFLKEGQADMVVKTIEAVEIPE